MATALAATVLTTPIAPVLSTATAQTATEVPIPRPSPRKVQAANPGQATATQTAPADQSPANSLLLQGANSPFAESGADSPEAAPLPLNPTAAAPAPDQPADIAPAPEVANLPSGPGPTDMRPGAFTLEARMVADGPPLGPGVVWRIFADQPGIDGKLPLLGEAFGGVIHVRLDPGAYLIHAAYGRSGASQRIEVSDPTGGEVLVLDSGGLRLLAVNARDQTLRSGEAYFDVFAHDQAGSDERFLVVAKAPPGRVISLNAGTYHVVSYYGDANAIVRADIRVDPGKLTEATIYQTAARLTLKLVEQKGGEAIADTEWSVVSPSGETIIESVGAFPNVVLSAGEYIAIARNAGRIFESTFAVEAGKHRDIEVLLAR